MPHLNTDLSNPLKAALNFLTISFYSVFTAYFTFYEEPFESFDPVVDIGMVGVISKYLFINAYTYIYISKRFHSLIQFWK